MAIGDDGEVSTGGDGGSGGNGPLEGVVEVIAQVVAIEGDGGSSGVVKLDPVGIVLEVSDVGDRAGVGGHELVDTDLAQKRGKEDGGEDGGFHEIAWGLL